MLRLTIDVEFLAGEDVQKAIDALTERALDGRLDMGAYHWMRDECPIGDVRVGNAEVVPVIDTAIQLGRMVITPAAAAVLDAAGGNPYALLARHGSGDWGRLDAHDRRANVRGLLHGGRILSAYTVGGATLWVITEGDRSVTTILTPEDY